MEAGTLLDVAGAVPESVTARLLEACRSGMFSKVQAAVVDTIADGWGVRLRSSGPHACWPLIKMCKQQGEYEHLLCKPQGVGRMPQEGHKAANATARRVQAAGAKPAVSQAYMAPLRNRQASSAMHSWSISLHCRLCVQRRGMCSWSRRLMVRCSYIQGDAEQLLVPMPCPSGF